MYALFGTPTSLLMRSELVRSRNPFYEERHAPFEDAHVCFDVLRTWNFGFVHQVLTYSRRDNESILSRIRPYQFELFSRLAKIIAHGRNYLSEDEYRYLLERCGAQVFLLPWEGCLARQGFKVLGVSPGALGLDQLLSRFRFMAKWILLVLLDHVGNPKRTWEYLWPRRGRIFAGTSRFIGTLRRMFARKRFAEKL